MMRFWWQPIGLYICIPSTIYFISVYHFCSLTRTRRLVLYTTILLLSSTVLSFFFFFALGYLLSNKSVFFFGVQHMLPPR